MGVKKVRSIAYRDFGSDTLTVADLESLVAGIDPAAEVKVDVYVNKADRPYTSDQTTVTLSIEE